MSAEATPTTRTLGGRVLTWFRARPRLVDALLAGTLWVLCSLTFLVSLGSEPPSGVDSGDRDREAIGFFLVSTVQILPLAWRRSRPELSFVLVVAGHVLQLVLAETPLPANISALMSAYAVAGYSERVWVRRAGLGVAAVAGVLATQDWAGYRDVSRGAQVTTSLFFSSLAMVCWLWGDLTRKRREVLLRLREQNEALRRDRDQRARIAAQDERTRIAREMHDIVAHSLSVVVVQADGAAYSATHGEAFDRDQAHRALTTIGTTAREALSETRRLVGVLRTTEDEGGEAADLEYTPTESLADLPDLVDRVAATGIDVTLESTIDLSRVPREAGLAGFRIVQESLTNVIKHAGPAARTTVRVTGGPELVIEVRDNGRGAAVLDDGNGHGIIGMRERATSAGGTMTAGPAPGGGFVVTASLPFVTPEEPR